MAQNDSTSHMEIDPKDSESVQYSDDCNAPGNVTNVSHYSSLCARRRETQCAALKMW